MSGWAEAWSGKPDAIESHAHSFLWLFPIQCFLVFERENAIPSHSPLSHVRFPCIWTKCDFSLKLLEWVRPSRFPTSLNPLPGNDTPHTTTMLELTLRQPRLDKLHVPFFITHWAINRSDFKLEFKTPLTSLFAICILHVKLQKG